MKHISRRTLIRSAGVALALPLLEPIAPAQAPLARAATTPKSRSADIVVPRTKYRCVPSSKGLLFEDEQGCFRYAIRGDEVFTYAHANFGWGLRPDRAHLWETICRYRGSDPAAMTEEMILVVTRGGGLYCFKGEEFVIVFDVTRYIKQNGRVVADGVTHMGTLRGAPAASLLQEVHRDLAEEGPSDDVEKFL